MPEHDEKIQRLWSDYKKTGDPDLRNRLMEHYLPNVRYIAERIHVRLPHHMDVDDLISAGIFGLMDAIEKYDPSKGFKFETYCVNRIRGTILDDLRAEDWVPRLVRTRTHKLERAIHKLELRFGRSPSDTEIAGELHITLDEYDQQLREISTAGMLSVSKRWSTVDDKPTLERVDVIDTKKERNPETQTQLRELFNYISKWLSKKERLVMMLYYVENFTMKEIGATLDITESRVSQIHASTLLRLRARMGKLKGSFV
jgi:RNA polymerase sigma factor for flagellar operon FliA